MIFDCDGVLVDSEPISIDVLLEMITAAGGDISREAAYEHFLGRSVAKIVEELKRSHKIEVADGLLDQMRRALYDRFRRELKPIPSITAALARLHRTVCVASSGQLERIRVSLEVTGLAGWFGDHLFSASMVRRGKPAPDLFLFAAQSMGVPPAECIVVEDSPAGVTAAKNAGMRVIGFTGGSHADPAGLEAKLKALSPDRLLADMQRLPALLSELEGAG